jgi:hypothetical protein
MYRKGWPPTGEIVSGGAIQLGGIIDQADVLLLHSWVINDRVTALHVDDVIVIREPAIQRFVRLVRDRALTVYASEGSAVFADLYRGDLVLGRELVAQAREAG